MYNLLEISNCDNIENKYAVLFIVLMCSNSNFSLGDEACMRWKLGRRTVMDTDKEGMERDIMRKR